MNIRYCLYNIKYFRHGRDADYPTVGTVYDRLGGVTASGSLILLPQSGNSANKIRCRRIPGRAILVIKRNQKPTFSKKVEKTVVFGVQVKNEGYSC